MVMERIEQAHEDLNQSKAKLEEADLTVRLTESRLISTKNSFKSGASTQLDLNRIDMLYHQALLLQSNAR